MSDSERAIDDDWNDGDSGLDDLLDEIGAVSEPLQEHDETEQSGDVDDSFDELLSVPEVGDEMEFSAGDLPIVEENDGGMEITGRSAAEPREISMNDDPLAEVAAIAAERNAEAAKKQGAVDGMGMRIALLSVSLLALLTAGFAAWQGYSNSARMEELAMAMQQRKPVVPATAANGDSALRADLEKISAQVNEMAATVDGSLVELRDSTKASMSALTERLDKLEAVKAPAMAKVESTAPPATEQVEENMQPPTTSSAPSGGWSVNLISLSNEKVADEELARLRNLGIRAEKHRVEQDGRVWFRLRVSGFTSHDGATAYIKTVEDKAGVSNAWVGRD